VFTEDDPYVGIDLDNCLDPDTGELQGWAADNVSAMNSYTEVSPSGTGIHIIIKGHLPENSRNRKGGIEVYDSNRFFVVTGHHLEGTPTSIESRQAELDELCAKELGEKPASVELEDDHIDHSANLQPEDDGVIKRALAAKNGAKFQKLWEGDYSAYKSQSEADCALCAMLAFYVKDDRQRIDRLFRHSGLYREKWEREDYRLDTIAKAITQPDTTTEVGPNGMYTVGELLALDIEAPKHIVEGLLTEGQFGFLAGRRGVGKTMIALQLGSALASGDSFLGRKISRPYRVAYIDMENGCAMLKERLQRQLNCPASAPEGNHSLGQNLLVIDAVDSSDFQALVLNEEGFKKLRAFVDQHKIEVLIIDNLGLVFGAEETDPASNTTLCNRLKALQSETTLKGGVILMLHHVVKNSVKRSERVNLLEDPDGYIDLVRGSGRLADFCPIRLAIGKETVGGNEFYVVNGIVRSAPVSPLILDFDEQTLSFQPVDDCELLSQTVFEGATRQKELFDMLPERFRFSEASKLKGGNGTAFSKGTIDATRRKALDNGLLAKEEDGSYRRIGQGEKA